MYMRSFRADESVCARASKSVSWGIFATVLIPKIPSELLEDQNVELEIKRGQTKTFTQKQ